MTEQYTQEDYEQWKREIRPPEKPIQTENKELREWIRVMFELSREDMCQWRKEHNQIDELIGMPNNKKLEQSNVQKEVKIVKVKQQKKTPEQPKKVTSQDVMDFITEQFRKRNEIIIRQMKEDQQRHHEELMKTMDEGFKKVAETMDRCLKNMSKTLDSTSESIIINPKTEIRDCLLYTSRCV